MKLQFRRGKPEREKNEINFYPIIMTENGVLWHTTNNNRQQLRQQKMADKCFVNTIITSCRSILYGIHTEGVLQLLYNNM
jgi:hypothetical protein